MTFAGKKKPAPVDDPVLKYWTPDPPKITVLPDKRFTKPLKDVLKAYGLKPRQYDLKRDGWMDNNNPTGLPTPRFSLTLFDEDALGKTQTMLVDKYITGHLGVTGKYRPNQDHPARQGLLDRYIDFYTEQGMEGGIIWCMTPGNNQKLSFYNGELGIVSLRFAPKGPLANPKNEHYTRFEHNLDNVLIMDGMIPRQLAWSSIKLPS